MTEVTQSGLSSGRVLDSIARINYLHNRYRRAGKISDDDMLYTLSLFALEPSRWSRRMDWRGFSDVELCAEGVVWRDIGETLEIPYGALVPYLKGGGEDGVAWLTALEEWSMRYEAENAIPDETNRKVAVGTIDILLFDVPVVARGFFSGVISAVLDARTRTAMKYVLTPQAYIAPLQILTSITGYLSQVFSQELLQTPSSQPAGCSSPTSASPAQNSSP